MAWKIRPYMLPNLPVKFCMNGVLNIWDFLTFIRFYFYVGLSFVMKIWSSVSRAFNMNIVGRMYLWDTCTFYVSDKNGKTLTDKALLYSRILLITNFKCLWFITKRNFTKPSSSVLQNSIRFCLLQWSGPAKHRRLMKDFISILSVSFASLSLLKLCWKMKIY
jgi:hypothetical protein